MPIQKYPYYIAEWQIGRISGDAIPLECRFVPSIKRMFEDGRIGGRRTINLENTSLDALASEVRRQGKSINEVDFYVVRQMDRPRERLPYWNIERILREERRSPSREP